MLDRLGGSTARRPVTLGGALLLLHLCGVSGADIASDYALSRKQMIERDPGYAEEFVKLLERHDTTIERAIAAVVAEPIPETLTIVGLKGGGTRSAPDAPPRAPMPGRR